MFPVIAIVLVQNYFFENAWKEYKRSRNDYDLNKSCLENKKNNRQGHPVYT